MNRSNINSDGIELVLASTEVGMAMDEAIQMVRLQRSVGWKGEEVPTHTLRAFSLGAVTGLVDLGYNLLAKAENGQVVGFARVAAAGSREKHYLHELVVANDLQLKGLGKRLMNGVLAESKQRGAQELLFTFNALNPRNAFFYLEKCGAKGLRILPDFYGKPVDGRAFVMFSRIELEPSHLFSPSVSADSIDPARLSNSSVPAPSSIPVIAEAAQYQGQQSFKVPVPDHPSDFLAHDHPLTLMMDELLIDLLTKGEFAITGYHRSRTHFWIVSRID